MGRWPKNCATISPRSQHTVPGKNAIRYGDQHSASMSMHAAVSWREAQRHRGFSAAGTGAASSVPGRCSAPPRSEASTQASSAAMGTACPTERRSDMASVTGERSMAQLS